MAVYMYVCFVSTMCYTNIMWCTFMWNTCVHIAWGMLKISTRFHVAASCVCCPSMHWGVGVKFGDKPLPSACPLSGGGGASCVPCRGCVPIIGVNEFWEDDVDIPGVVVWEVVIQITRLSPSG